MLTLLGFSILLPSYLQFLALPWVAFSINIAAWLLIIIVVDVILLRLLRYITRSLSGDLEDIVFAILRRPLIFLIGVYGVVHSLDVLPLAEVIRQFILVLTYTIVVLVITHILGRVIKDILVYYGEKWARRTASRVDDVLVPVLNLFGPVVLVMSAALIILPLWGFNITSVLVGAGVIGLVLGLALQDSISNIFSGLSLLVEAPFGTGDLITLEDGRVCKVERIGMRSTQLYSVVEHAIVYVPNKIFSTTILTNITKPTVDQKFVLDIKIKGGKDLAAVEENLRKIAAAHPATLVADMDLKIPLLKEQIVTLRHQAEKLGKDHVAYATLMTEAERNEQCIPRLEMEGRWNCQLDSLQDAIRSLIRGIKAREINGLNAAELQEIYCNFVSPIEHEIELVNSLVKAWSEIPDPWLDHTDHWDLHHLWEMRGAQLETEWNIFKKQLFHPDDRTELRLDELGKGLLDWIQRDYKIVPAYWKNPVVNLKGFYAQTAELNLAYYVDNIRLEHDERANRVSSEIARQVREYLYDTGVWG